MNAGIRNPRRSLRICASLLAVSVVSLLSGILAMVLAGAETTFSAVAIGLGALGSIVFFFMLLNFAWGLRLFEAIRRGENLIARWTVTAEELDRFRRNEATHAAQGHPNDYTPPRETPAAGIEVIFATDAVVIGDTFFGLATAGVAHIRQVGIVPGDPLCLGFQTSMTTGRMQSSGMPSFRNALGLLRIPVTGTAHSEAKRVIDHYVAALAGQIVVKPDFWRRRVRWGVCAAAIGAAVSLAGFILHAVGAELGEAPQILAAAGAAAAAGGLVLAFFAWLLAGRQRRGRAA